MKKFSKVFAIAIILLCTSQIKTKEITPLVPDIYPQSIRDLTMQLNGIIIKTNNLSGDALNKAFKNYYETVVPKISKLYGDVIQFGLGPIVKFDLPENNEQIRALGAIQAIMQQTFNFSKALFPVAQTPIEFKSSQRFFNDLIKDIGDKANDYVDAKPAAIKDNLVAQFNKIPNWTITMQPTFRAMPDKALNPEQKKAVIAYAEILETVLTAAKKWLKIA